MDRDTFTEAIQTLQRRTPFRPFTVITVAGNRYEVDRPNVIAIRDGGMALFVAPGNVPVIFDHEGVSEVVGDLSGQPANA